MQDKQALLEAVERGEMRLSKEQIKHLRAELAEYAADTINEAEALRRGWEPAGIPARWYVGHVESGERWSWPVRIFWGLLGLSAVTWTGMPLSIGFAVPAGILLACALFWGLLLVTVVGIDLDFTHRPRLSAFLQRQWDSVNGRGDSTPGHAHYIGAIPTSVWKKYRRDRHLFDECFIAAPQRESFFAYTAPIVDPMLFGRIGHKTFRGATWDLAEDLKEQKLDAVSRT